MQTWRRATVYFDPEIQRTLQLKAAAMERSVSEIGSEAVGLALGEDAADLEALAQRRGETVLSLDEVVRDLRRLDRISAPITAAAKELDARARRKDRQAVASAGCAPLPKILVRQDVSSSPASKISTESVRDGTGLRTPSRTIVWWSS